MRPLLFVLCSFLLSVAPCGASAAQATTEASPDTVNRLDGTGLKQGWWLVRAPKQDKPGYSDGQLIEEGRYTDNKRTGLWKRYWPSGKPMSEITYVGGFPRGDYRTFYPDGKPEEQGSWDLDRNTGAFKRWHPNGKLAQDFTFNPYGVRDGVQRYYHENGQLEVEVNISEGKEDGTLKRWYANGDPQQVAVFNDGVISAANSRYIKPVHRTEPPKPDISAPAAPERRAEETTNIALFRANGVNTLYDKQLRLSQQGEFKDGRLWNGKYYRYNGSGLLYRIEVYQQGRFVGTAPITDEDKGR